MFSGILSAIYSFIHCLIERNGVPARRVSSAYSQGYSSPQVGFQLGWAKMTDWGFFSQRLFYAAAALNEAWGRVRSGFEINAPHGVRSANHVPHMAVNPFQGLAKP